MLSEFFHVLCPIFCWNLSKKTPHKIWPTFCHIVLHLEKRHFNQFNNASLSIEINAFCWWFLKAKFLLTNSRLLSSKNSFYKTKKREIRKRGPVQLWRNISTEKSKREQRTKYLGISRIFWKFIEGFLTFSLFLGFLNPYFFRNKLKPVKIRLLLRKEGKVLMGKKSYLWLKQHECIWESGGFFESRIQKFWNLKLFFQDFLSEEVTFQFGESGLGFFPLKTKNLSKFNSENS